MRRKYRDLTAGLVVNPLPNAFQILPKKAEYVAQISEELRPLPLKLVALSQEHGKLEGDLHLPVGTRLRIVPNHSCLTAAMYDRYYAVDGGAVVGEWRPARGW